MSRTGEEAVSIEEGEHDIGIEELEVDKIDKGSKVANQGLKASVNVY